MSLEEQFYKEVTPEGKNNYVLTGQVKVLLLLCKAVDKLIVAQQIVQETAVPVAEHPYDGKVCNSEFCRCQQ